MANKLIIHIDIYMTCGIFEGGSPEYCIFYEKNNIFVSTKVCLARYIPMPI